MSEFRIENGILRKYTGTETHVVIPDGVQIIDDDAFSGCQSMQSVSIPDSVTQIRDRAFRSCSELRSVTIPTGVTAIGSEAFCRCSSLQSITLPDSVTRLGDSMFLYCPKLQGTVYENAVYLGNESNPYLFLQKAVNKEITSCQIHEKTKVIFTEAFSDCEKLKDVTIPDGVTHIGNFAFHYCSSLQSISLPDSVTEIGELAFYNCKKLKSFTISDHVTSVGKGLFFFCNGLESVQIGSGITAISDSMFKFCMNLQSITIPDGVTSIGIESMYGCRNLQSIHIGAGVTEIDDGTFTNCIGLQDVYIGDAIKSIGLMFGKTLPNGLRGYIGKWYPRMSDAAIKAYVLNKETLAALDEETQAEIFITKQSKALTKYFMPLMTETLASRLAAEYCKKAASSLSAAECNKIGSFIIAYHTKVSVESLRSLYAALLTQKNRKKALEEIGKDLILSAKLSESDEKPQNLTETEKKLFAFADAHKISVAEMTQRLKAYYGLTPEDIPTVSDTEGKPVAPLAMLCLLTAHETAHDNEVIVQYKSGGIAPEAEEILSLLAPDSLQAALRKLADRHLGISGHSKKMYLAYPICRYADEALMEHLTKQAPKWRSYVSGNDAPPLRTFREANLYSETRAAILLAEKYKELDRYAGIRGMTEDLLRDRILSDVGLSADGKKSYDLGNQTATAVLQPDLSFLVLLENGKTAKSLPKKGADPAAYAAANADFTVMKKNAKTIVKNRRNILFEEFLSGKARAASEWKAAYTENPLLRAVARLLVWKQGENTFILTADGAVTSDGTPYVIEKTKIALAHPMEMTEVDLCAWQKYFVENSLKQPFEQIWEPVVHPESVTEDRYKGCMIPYYRFTGKEKHGIFVADNDFHNEIVIALESLHANIERIDLQWHQINPDDRFEIQSIAVKTHSRMSNHILAYLDRITVYDRVAKDDVSVEKLLPVFTLAQIMEFIRIATENNAVNVTAMLLQYKNENFTDFDPLDEFSLDFE